MKYISFEENIKNNLLSFAKGELENEDQFLFDLFKYCSLEKLNTILVPFDESIKAIFNTFIEKHYSILSDRKADILNGITDQIEGSPLAVAISYLIKKRLYYEQLIEMNNNVIQINLYYRNIVNALNLLISTYRGKLQYELTSKNKFDIYDYFGAFLLSKRHKTESLRQRVDLDAQALEVFVDRCSILYNDQLYVARVPFELTKDGVIGIELVHRERISKVLSYYQLNFSDEVRLPIIKKTTILNDIEFKKNLYLFFHYLNTRITDDDIIIFIQTLRNQMHEKYSDYDRNRVRLLLNQTISTRKDGNAMFCTALIVSLKYIGNNDNLYDVLSEYFNPDISDVSLSKSTFKYYIGVDQNKKELLGKFKNIVKVILNE